ncbi:MAG: biopolymer transporter ExbD [Opitutaceae bacterium]|nr:biopolymer transporter ExbD [Opitutaceae bacterium]MBP9912936.1 biopolymer transporter ExbD [Opitutaceae bacterium]
MARTFRRRHVQHPLSELNVTNLIDVAFTLLIIFMIATPLMQQEQAIQVNLPTETKRPQDKPDKDLTFQTVGINKAGEYYWGSRRVDFSELPALLEAEGRKEKPAVIRIRADWNLQYQKVITLVDEIKKHNLTKLTFDTQTTD